VHFENFPEIIKVSYLPCVKINNAHPAQGMLFYKTIAL